MSARSTVVRVENHSSVQLTLDERSMGLAHGEWVAYPPKTIAPAQGVVPTEGQWENDSDGFMTGDQGSCVYHFADRNQQIQSITINWDNPYIGSDSYQITTTSNQVAVSYEGGGGNNAVVTFIVKDTD